jgi:hypothetical protein
VEQGQVVVAIFALMVFAGVGLFMAAMTSRRKMREMEHRERLAMIERGLVPSPETDPAGFESATGLSGPQRGASGAPYRTAGVLMIGFGLGLMMLITFSAGNFQVGLGIGGAWAILGAASLVNYFLIANREHTVTTRHWTPAAPSRPPAEPPANVAP